MSAPIETPNTPTAALAQWPRRPRRLATALVDDLVDRIVSGAMLPGTTLPIEPVLCDTFGVSRTVVREAIKTLESMRLVRALQGHGTTVRPFADWDLFNPAVLSAVVRHDERNSILEDLVHVRCGLEAQMAAQAALRATDGERRAIVERMKVLEGAVGDLASYTLADIEFHDAIMAASGNRLGRAILRNLTDEAHRSLRYFGEPPHEHYVASNAAHQMVCDAVVAGRADEALAAMSSHILQSWNRRKPGA